MDIRRESLLHFLSGIEEEGEEVIEKENVQESSYTHGPQQIPPVNPQIMRELAFRLERSAVDLNAMVSWLEGEMSKMSQHTTTFTDLHSAAVDELTDTADVTVKAVYSLLSKAGALQKDMTKIEMMSSHVKSINKYLERLDNTLAALKPGQKPMT